MVSRQASVPLSCNIGVQTRYMSCGQYYIAQNWGFSKGDIR